MRHAKIAPIRLFARRGADMAVRRNCELSRKRKLRELYSYTALLNAGHPPQVHDWAVADEPSDNEQRFLDENDIAKYVAFLLVVPFFLVIYLFCPVYCRLLLSGCLLSRAPSPSPSPSLSPPPIPLTSDRVTEAAASTF